MIGSPMERRRAERFAELLDAVEGRRRRHNRTAWDEDLTTLVNVGGALAGLAPAAAAGSAPSPRFRDELRDRLMSIARTEGVGAPEKSEPLDEVSADVEERKAPGNRRRAVVAAALAAGVLGLSGVSTASGDAVPGDTLYGVKRSTERAQLALAGSDVSRGQLHFEFARTRLGEAGSVHGPDAVTATLDDMDAETVQGVAALATAAVDQQDSGILDAVDGFVDEQSAGLTALMSGLDGASYDAASRSVSLLEVAADRARQLRGSLPCTSAGSDSEDRFGPVPGDCAALPGGDPGGTPVEPAPGPESASGGSTDPESPSPSESPSADNSESPPNSAEPSDGNVQSVDEDDSDDFLSDLGDLLSGIFQSGEDDSPRESH